MGNCCSVQGAIDHWIYIKTGDCKGTGPVDAKVRVILHDDNGNQSPEIALDCYFKSETPRGHTEVFQAPPLGGFGEVIRIEMWKEGAQNTDWYCELIMVNDRVSDKCYYFPVQRWVRPNQRYKITAFDTLLPQYDSNRDQRDAELREKRELYQYGQSAPDLPVQIRVLPADEQFSDEYKWDLMASKSQYLIHANITRLSTAPWEDLEDLTAMYQEPWFPTPVGVTRWSNDICFGAQRLIGCNPNQIKLCTQLPESMGVTAEMLRPYLEGWTLKQIIEARRLFSVDLKILEDLPTSQDRALCAPIGLFFVTGEKHLVPIAIQLYQDIAPDNPVFLPNDNPFTWLLAKMWFNNADAAVHQSLSHLGFTHLLMEGISIAMQRHLSPSHPVYKLLAPHFLFLMTINARGTDQLLQPNGWVDVTTTVGREGMFELMRRGLEDWRVDVQGNFPKELESRGVLDPRILPNYGYRDDGILLHKAIDLYVTKVLRIFYDVPNKLHEDYELNNWGAELALGKDDGGVGIMGMPAKGHFRKVEELALLCTSILFTCSVQHAAVNFSQYDEYAFPPNYPALLMGDPPMDKLPKTEEDITACLPDKGITIETMTMTKLMSSRSNKSLGEWEFQFHYDPAVLAVEKQFREELQRISKVIQQRNEERDEFYKYPYLDPDNLPNTVCI